MGGRVPPTRAATGQLEEDTQTGCNPIIGSLFWSRGDDGDHNHGDYNHRQLLKLKQGFSHLLSSISRFTNVRKRLFENVSNIKQSCNSSKEIQCNNGVAK